MFACLPVCFSGREVNLREVLLDYVTLIRSPREGQVEGVVFKSQVVENHTVGTYITGSQVEKGENVRRRTGCCVDSSRTGADGGADGLSLREIHFTIYMLERSSLKFIDSHHAPLPGCDQCEWCRKYQLPAFPIIGPVIIIFWGKLSRSCESKFTRKKGYSVFSELVLGEQ